MSKGIIGVTVGTPINPEKFKASPEDIQAAVDAYLAENPVEGGVGSRWFFGEIGKGHDVLISQFDVTSIPTSKKDDFYLDTYKKSVYQSNGTKFVLVAHIDANYAVKTTPQEFTAVQKKNACNNIGAVPQEGFSETLNAAIAEAVANGDFDGKDGSVWYTGTVITGGIVSWENDPSITPKAGDYYLNTDTGDYFVASENESWVRKGNLEGAQWFTGNKIDADGKAWGYDVDIASLVKDGDYYLNTDTGDYFVADGAKWWLRGNLKGAPGESGDDGSQWFTGTFETGSMLVSDVDGAKEGDFYLNTDTSELYRAGETYWEHQATLRGAPGKNGDPGKDGSAWYSGDIINTDGMLLSIVVGAKEGDFYFNTSTGAVYKGVGTVWKYQCTLQGGSGKSAYQYAKEGGYTGSEAEFATKLAAEYLTTESDPTVPSWAKSSSKPSYTKSEVGLGNVDNVKQYSSSNPPPYPVTSVNGKTGAVTVTVPTKVSELTNDKNYLTAVPGEYVTETELNAKGYLTSFTESDPTVPSWAKSSSKPSYTKTEVGLGNVDNVKQYSASNPPPYPVDSVNGKKGAVTLGYLDVGASAESWTFTLKSGGTVTKSILIPDSGSPS